MKKYLKPQNRIIDLCEESCILSGSLDQEEREVNVNQDYAEEALSNKKNSIWKNSGMWSDE